jgi:hypothetical protein
MNAESTVLSLPVNNLSVGLSGSNGNAICEHVPLPEKTSPLILECKLQDCDVTLELRTLGGVKDGVHRWTQLSATTYLTKTQRRLLRGVPAPRPRKIRITFTIADLSECRMNHWRSDDDDLWIGSTSFDLDPKDAARVTEFAVTLGVKVEDLTSGSGS